MRNCAIILAFFVAATYATAQSPIIGSGDSQSQTIRSPRPQPADGGNTKAPADSSNVVSPAWEATMDWNGEWTAEYGGLLNRRMIKITIHRDGDSIVGTYSDERSQVYGRTALVARYSGKNTFTGTVDPNTDSAGKSSFKLTDPDTIAVAPGYPLHHLSKPALDDIPCSIDNPLHVNIDGVIAREKVAIEAKAWAQTACWSYIAAMTGDTDSLYTAGYLMRRGIGVEKDSTKAFYMLEHSALQGNYQAQLEAAEMTEQGEGAAESPLMAKRFREMAQMQVAAKQLGQLMDADDRINKGIKGIFGPAYPGDECGISYDFYANWSHTHPNDKSPCDNPELRRRYGSK